MQAVSGMTINQATDEFTVAFKKSTAAALKISVDSVDNVNYKNTEARRQLLAGNNNNDNFAYNPGP
jgi:hypothetical protein